MSSQGLILQTRCSMGKAKHSVLYDIIYTNYTYIQSNHTHFIKIYSYSLLGNFCIVQARCHSVLSHDSGDKVEMNFSDIWMASPFNESALEENCLWWGDCEFSFGCTEFEVFLRLSTLVRPRRHLSYMGLGFKGAVRAADVDS